MKPYGRERAIKLNRACYIMRIIKPMMSRESLITIYHSYFHSILRYGILFWRNTPISKDIFKIQKRIVRIITNKNRRESCRELFKNLKILTLNSQYNIPTFFLSLKIKNYLHLIKISIASILDTILIFIYLPRIYQLSKEV